MSKPYRPSNGTEGMVFDERFCDHCVHDEKYRRTQDGEDSCNILMRAMAHDIDEPEYPSEWIEDDDGPRCTAFVSRYTDSVMQLTEAMEELIDTVRDHPAYRDPPLYDPLPEAVSKAKAALKQNGFPK